MSRYRKIDPRVWNDEKFRSLSDAGKLVFLMLLTHPNMTALGAMRATPSGLAEELGWTVEAFREAFAEAIAKGMAEHDRKACLIALPNFLRYNSPESPNVVKAWVGALDLLPECPLKTRVIARSKAFAEGMNKGFAEALPEAFAIPLSKGMPIPEQEQEQEQEQKQIKNTPPEKKRRGKPKPENIDPQTALPDVDPQVVADWMHVRTSKRAGALTETGLAAIRGEADKAGMSMQAVLTMCCSRNWVGFNASWVNRGNGQGAPPHKTAKQAESDDFMGRLTGNGSTHRVTESMDRAAVRAAGDDLRHGENAEPMAEPGLGRSKKILGDGTGPV